MYQDDLTFETFKRKSKRIASKRRLSDLVDESLPNRFLDRSLQALFEKGYIQDLVWQLQQGKEATVFVATSGQGLVAVKVYADIRARSFRNDACYREGRHIADSRLERAIRDRTHTGIDAQLGLWVEQEYRELSRLHRAGLSVPEPIVCIGNVIVMQFIGDENGAASRLSDIHLSPAEAHAAYQSAKNLLIGFAQLGRVHGDFSTFNLLWHEGNTYAIDFPQMVHFSENPQADALLKRDIRSVAKTFRKLGVTVDEASLYHEVSKHIDF